MAQKSAEDLKQQRLSFKASLEGKRGIEYRALVGIDGFVDEITQLVRTRHDHERYDRMATITEFSRKVGGFAGRSGNIEGVTQNIKLGGNGPIMTNCLGRLGIHTDFIGAVGHPDIHPTFEPLKQWGEVISLVDPAHTLALEFEDGKVLLGRMSTLNEVRWDRIVEVYGGEDKIAETLKKYQLVGLTNWTMVPHCTEVYREMMRVASGLDTPPKFFFDLCDPAKRTTESIQEMLKALGDATDPIHTILGLNHNEALQIAAAAGVTDIDDSEEGDALCKLALAIREATGIAEIMIHPRKRAAVSTAEVNVCVEGCFTPNPKLSTGAGDNLNGGYCFARLMGLDPETSLGVGQAVAGHYIRNGQSPTYDDVIGFCEKWAEGSVDH